MSHTIVMTGATRGIGRFAIEQIASADPDARLVILGRGRAATDLAAHLRTGDRPVSAIDTDLSSMASVRAAVDRLRTELDSGLLPPLRALVANAGLQFANDVTKTDDGFEATYAVNVLANHVLVRGLEDHFDTAARIVITVSDTHFGDLKHNLGLVPAPAWTHPDQLARTGAFANPESAVAGRTAYSTSKLAAIYLIHKYARRLPAGIDVVGFNPGFVPGTGLARDAGRIAQFAIKSLSPVLTLTPIATTQDTAGRHLANVVLGHTAAPTGSYVDRAEVARSSDESYNPERERETWCSAEELTISRRS